MPVIRKKLFPSEVYPADLRYNADTDKVQSLIHGTWTDNPAADPRAQTTFPPHMTTHPNCDGAQSIADALKHTLAGVTDAITNSKTVFTLAGIILGLFEFGPFAVFIALALFLAGLMLDAGATAVAAALTDTVYHTFACILFCHMKDGALVPGSLGTIEGDIDTLIGGLAATILKSMCNLAGEGGLNNLAALGTSIGDCSDCGCPCGDCEVVDQLTFLYTDAAWQTDGGSPTLYRYSSFTPPGSFDSIIIFDTSDTTLNLGIDRCIKSIVWGNGYDPTGWGVMINGVTYPATSNNAGSTGAPNCVTHNLTIDFGDGSVTGNLIHIVRLTHPEDNAIAMGCLTVNYCA